jgi:hypothetical protein
MMAAPAMVVHWDQLVKALQYRDAPEYGVGHNVGVEVDLEANGGCSRLRTTWIPQATVEKVSAREDVGCELGMEELDRRTSEGYPADALDLDVAGDQATKVAIARALTELATHPLAQLRGTRLEEMDFNALLVDWRSCGSASALEASPGKGETPYDE